MITKKVFCEPQAIIIVIEQVNVLSSAEGLKPGIDTETGYGSLVG